MVAIMSEGPNEGKTEGHQGFLRLSGVARVIRGCLGCLGLLGVAIKRGGGQTNVRQTVVRGY